MADFTSPYPDLSYSKGPKQLYFNQNYDETLFSVVLNVPQNDEDDEWGRTEIIGMRQVVDRLTALVADVNGTDVSVTGGLVKRVTQIETIVDFANTQVTVGTTALKQGELDFGSGSKLTSSSLLFSTLFSLQASSSPDTVLMKFLNDDKLYLKALQQAGGSKLFELKSGDDTYIRLTKGTANDQIYLVASTVSITGDISHQSGDLWTNNLMSNVVRLGGPTTTGQVIGVSNLSLSSASNTEGTVNISGETINMQQDNSAYISLVSDSIGLIPGSGGFVSVIGTLVLGDLELTYSDSKISADDGTSSYSLLSTGLTYSHTVRATTLSINDETIRLDRGTSSLLIIGTDARISGDNSDDSYTLAATTGLNLLSSSHRALLQSDSISITNLSSGLGFEVDVPGDYFKYICQEGEVLGGDLGEGIGGLPMPYLGVNYGTPISASAYFTIEDGSPAIFASTAVTNASSSFKLQALNGGSTTIEAQAFNSGSNISGNSVITLTTRSYDVSAELINTWYIFNNPHGVGKTTGYDTSTGGALTFSRAHGGTSTPLADGSNVSLCLSRFNTFVGVSTVIAPQEALDVGGRLALKENMATGITLRTGRVVLYVDGTGGSAALKLMLSNGDIKTITTS